MTSAVAEIVSSIAVLTWPTVCVLVFSQERATGGAARVLPKDTDRRGGGHEIPPRREPQADSPSRSAGRFARIPVMRRSHRREQAGQNAYSRG
jgi:hypothetical protein